jgi:RIO kinase 1
MDFLEEESGLAPLGRSRSSGRDHAGQLDRFYERGLITEVLGLVKTGKEASVYCCQAGEALGRGLVAAKIYRARQYRFRNDAVYQQSRQRELGLRGRALRAFEQKSAFGREVRGATWVQHEFDTLARLHAAGGDVPRPLAVASDALIMAFFGSADEPARQLNQVQLDATEAAALFARVLANVELALACNRVHGDLSPHNLLYWRGELRLIDFPQAVDPRFNPAAADLLRRDLANVCRYFGRFGVVADAAALADDLWQRFEYGDL